MANLCDFEIKAVGSKESIQSLIEVFENSCSLDIDTTKPFLAWIENCYVCKKTDNTVIFYGVCKWSLYSMWSYYCDLKDSPDYSGVTHLEKLSEDLNLDIETFANEEGCDFAEHQIYSNGVTSIDDTVEMQKNAINNISCKFDLEKERVESFLENFDDFDVDQMEQHDDLINLKFEDEYVFGEGFIYNPAKFVCFEDGTKYGNFTIGA